MLAWGVAQLLGGVLLLLLPRLPEPGVFMLAIPIVLAGLAHSRWRWVAALWLGAALAFWSADARLGDRLPANLDGEVFEILGTVTGLVEQEYGRQRFHFRIESGMQGRQPVALPTEVRLNVYEPLDIQTGERWQLRVKLRSPRGFGNPGGFDYERWLFAQGIGATGYVRDIRSARRLSAADGEWRADIAGRVAALASGPAAGLVRGLATADRSAISDEHWELLRVTGTAHLMAISGLHIGLVAGLGLALAGLLRRRFAPHRGLAWPALLAGGLALVYGMLAGFGLPVQRALVGTAVLLLALAWRRAIAPGHAYGVALTAVLCLDPLAPLDAGFWMSFGAVAAILFLLSGRRPQGSKLAATLRVQFGLFLLLAPLTAAHFGLVPLVSPLANLVAIPSFGFIVVPLVLTAMLLLWWPPAAGALFGWAGLVLEILLQGFEWLAALTPPFAPAQPAPEAWLLAVAGLLLLAAPRALPGRWFAAWLLLPAGLVLAAPWLPPDRAAMPLAMHFLDVGQGLAVVVETPRHTLVYDTGPGFGENDAAKRVVIPFLESRGRRPDIVLVSHGDGDHAGGLASLRKRYPEARFAGRTRIADELEDCAALHWRWEQVQFEVLDSGVVGSAHDNNASCVLRIARAGFAALLTGDIEAPAEARLVKNAGQRLRAHVVLAPHHGSRSSSTQQFVRAVQPTLVIAAAGYGNQWDFPKPDVVARWRAAGAHMLDTGGQGAISVRISDKEYCVASYRETQRPWRQPASQQSGGCRRFDGYGK